MAKKQTCKQQLKSEMIMQTKAKVDNVINVLMSTKMNASIKVDDDDDWRTTVLA